MLLVPEQLYTKPLLENGDHLNRLEFESRYEKLPNLKKIELIEGVVYMGSPVRITQHGRPHSRIMLWLGTYQFAMPGTDLGDNCSVRLDMDNEPQPDALLRWEDGNSTIDEEGYLVGAPELIVEIAASSQSYDLHSKKSLYRRHGVQEYLVWRINDQALDWFELQHGQYQRRTPDEHGVIASKRFSGLWLHVSALLADDMKMVMATLQVGLGDMTANQKAR